MHLNDPRKDLYKGWPARDDREAMALKLLVEARSDLIMEKTGMSREEYKDFMKWAREYEVSHMCVKGGDANAGK